MSAPAPCPGTTDGGHCWQRTGLSRSSSPPQYAERCKHCPAGRWAVPQEPFRYTYDPVPEFP